MADQNDDKQDPASEQAERVGRVNVDYGEADWIDGRRSETMRGRLPALILAGIIAIALMVGALLLILPGVFEM